MTPQEISVAGGVIISLGFAYIPKLKGWFDPKPGDQKRLILLGLLAAVTAVSFGLSCLGWYPLFPCSVAGIKPAVEAFFLAAIANQTAYALEPKQNRG